jgi:hypothetical protein
MKYLAWTVHVQEFEIEFTKHQLTNLNVDLV